jgi:hypothetical protein
MACLLKYNAESIVCVKKKYGLNVKKFGFTFRKKRQKVFSIQTKLITEVSLYNSIVKR